MKLMKMLTTHELENEIIKLIKKLQKCDEVNVDLIFKKNIEKGEDGIYVFAYNRGYHYVISERGCELTHKVTDDVFEICYWAIYPLALRMSFDYECKNRKSLNDSRQVAFGKLLEYLSELGTNYKKRGEIEIDEILKVNPY